MKKDQDKAIADHFRKLGKLSWESRKRRILGLSTGKAKRGLTNERAKSKM